MLFFKKLFDKKNTQESTTTKIIHIDKRSALTSAPLTVEDGTNNNAHLANQSDNETTSPGSTVHYSNTPLVNKGGLPWDFWDIIIPTQRGITFSDTDFPAIRASDAYKKRILEILPDPNYAKLVVKIYEEYPEYQEQIDNIRKSTKYKEKVAPLLAQPTHDEALDYLYQLQQQTALIDEENKNLLSTPYFTATSKVRNAK